MEFLQNMFQQAANDFREALNGDEEPKWTVVWSHINLGKIFDITGSARPRGKRVQPGDPHEGRYAGRAGRSVEVPEDAVRAPKADGAVKASERHGPANRHEMTRDSARGISVLTGPFVRPQFFYARPDLVSSAFGSGSRPIKRR